VNLFGNARTYGTYYFARLCPFRFFMDFWSRGASFGPYIWKGPFGLLNYRTWKDELEIGKVERFFVQRMKTNSDGSLDWSHAEAA